MGRPAGRRTAQRSPIPKRLQPVATLLAFAKVQIDRGIIPAMSSVRWNGGEGETKKGVGGIGGLKV